MQLESLKKLAFFAYTHNLAEVTRAIEIAKVLRLRGCDIHFFSHGGPHENFILDAKFPLTTLRPFITSEKHEFLIGIEQGRTFHLPFTRPELESYVESEVAALRDFCPDGVYFGMNIPCIVSARAAGLPLIVVIPLPGHPVYFRQRMATFPESHENMLLRILPQRWKDLFFCWAIQRFTFGLDRLNRVALSFGVPPFKGYGEAYLGDLTLLTDLPDLTGIPESVLPQNCHYIGPIFAHLPLPLSEQIRKVFARPGWNVFFAMGSSAYPRILMEGALALRDSGYNVVIATTSIMDPKALKPLPENVYATRYVPAPQVNELADIAVIHGGQGTIQTACWAGTPVVGVALQFEQQANLDTVVRAGMGVRIPLYKYNQDRILEEIDRIFSDERYRNNARRIQALVRNVDGAINAADRILEFLNRSNR